MKNFHGSEIEKLLTDHKDLQASIAVLKVLKGMENMDNDEIFIKVNAIIDTLREHISMEENVVFSLARESLNTQELEQISKKMQLFRKANFGKVAE